jgi:uncharacterized membrane protein
MDDAVDRNGYYIPHIRSVETGRPLIWLRQGLADIKRAPGPSLGNGVIVAAGGIFIWSVAWGVEHLVPALTTGFLLVAPFLAIMLYALSRQIEQGQPVNAAEAFFAFRRNSGSISLYALLMALALIMWERMSAIIFALFYGGVVPDLNNLLADLFLSGDYVPFLIAYFGIGAIVAVAVFTVSVVSLPLMVDRDIDVITAIITSMQCCLRNPAPMLVWALVIVALTVIGFATAMLGFVVIFPLLGHATWHAYRDLIE